MTTVILARHGETDWNRGGIWQGHGDPPLNDLGRKQAAALADQLAVETLDALYSSDLLRASETAAIISRVCGVPVRLDSELREIDVGSWTGLPHTEASERLARGERPDGEGRDEFHARVLAALHRVVSGHSTGRIVIVTHGGVARALRRHAQGEAKGLLGNGQHETYRYGSGRFSRVD